MVKDKSVQILSEIETLREQEKREALSSYKLFLCAAVQLLSWTVEFSIRLTVTIKNVTIISTS